MRLSRVMYFLMKDGGQTEDIFGAHLNVTELSVVPEAGRLWSGYVWDTDV